MYMLIQCYTNCMHCIFYFLPWGKSINHYIVIQS